MKKLILYLLEKYHGNWDMIYDSISNKEPVDWNIVYKVNDKFDFEYMPIVSDNYPDKLKTIYMPPFSLFYKGNLNFVNKNVLSVIGNLNHNEVNQLLKLAKNDVVICITNNDLNEYLFDKIITSKIRAIILCEKSINSFKFKKTNYNNIILLSEYNNSNFNKSIDQTIERLLYAFSDKIFVKNASKERLMYLVSNYDNAPKNFYSLEKYKNNLELNDVFNKNQLSFVKQIDDISFLIKS